MRAALDMESSSYRDYSVLYRSKYSSKMPQPAASMKIREDPADDGVELGHARVARPADRRKLLLSFDIRDTVIKFY